MQTSLLHATERPKMQEAQLNVVFRDMETSEAVYNSVFDHFEKLQHYHSHILNCHVTISAPHRHSTKGRIFHIGLRIHLRGKDIFINKEPEQNSGHEDVYVAIRDAFDAAERVLESHIDKLKTHKNYIPSQNGSDVEEES